MTAVPDWDIVGPGTDAELARAAAAGDRHAFAGIYDRYADRLHDFCVGMLGDRDAAADCVQDAFCTAATSLGGLREPDKLRPWLYAIARNEALRRLRDRRRERPADTLPEAVSPEAGPDVLAGRMELANLIAEVAGGLSDRDRSVLELAYRHGLDGPEVAQALGVSESAAKSMVFRLRDTIERCLGALLVSRDARTNPNRCPELASVLHGWDGKFTILMRKRIARHIDSCTVCDQERRRLVNPVALLGAVPVFIPAPGWLRDRTLGEIPPTGPGEQLRADTAPRPARTEGPLGTTAASGDSRVEPDGHEAAADARVKHRLTLAVALMVGIPLTILGGTIVWRYLPDTPVNPSGVTESEPASRPPAGPLTIAPAPNSLRRVHPLRARRHPRGPGLHHHQRRQDQASRNPQVSQNPSPNPR